MVTFPQVSPPKPFMHLSCPPYITLAPPVSFFLIYSPELYLERSMEHKVLVV